MPEIKIKHVISFSSEDKVHKAENLTKPETYRKWKCATPGEKSASVVLQFEKATQIHSIDIGNESSAFVEVLVGRSSDSVNDFQVLLVASSFMSPLESRTGTHTNRVRMFGPEKLSQNTKDEKWDCVQIICTQPFNKNLTYGLTFIKFHSPPEKIEDHQKNVESRTATVKLGAFKLKSDDDENVISAGLWFGKKKAEASGTPSNSEVKTSPSYAVAVLASASNAAKISSENNAIRKDEESNISHEPPTKKARTILNKDNIVYKDVLRVSESKKMPETNGDLKIASISKTLESRKAPVVTSSDKPSTSNKPATLKQKIPFEKILDKVIFVLSGFVNPIRSEIRDKALEMGAKYKGDWDSSCTHLVCAFLNTPKYVQVKKLNGRIVTKDWILDCYRKKNYLPWRNYMLGKLTIDSTDESDYSEEDESDCSNYSEEDDEYVDRKKNKKKNAKKAKNKLPNTLNKKNQPNTSSNKAVLSIPNNKNHSNTPNKKEKSNATNQENSSSNSQSSTTLIFDRPKDESETEDEEALQDYIADTDVDNDSGGDTEDEIRKVEMDIQKNTLSTSNIANDSEENTENLAKPNITDLPLPELPNLFKQKHFFLFGSFSPSKQHDLQRYITAYNGITEDYMNNKVKYVITEAKWDKNFENALSENEDLIFVKPTWIYKCHQAGKLVPYQPYIVIPDS